MGEAVARRPDCGEAAGPVGDDDVVQHVAGARANRKVVRAGVTGLAHLEPSQLGFEKDARWEEHDPSGVVLGMAPGEVHTAVLSTEGNRGGGEADGLQDRTA